MRILVTGGSGYIGSHTLVSLIREGYEVLVYDNLTNSSFEVIIRVQELTGKPIRFIRGDIQDAQRLSALFSEEKIEAVIHFAALKSVGESVANPLKYYNNNVYGSLCLLQAMLAAKVNNFIYSSSATVYGESNPSPYVETMNLGNPSSPYGASKVMLERVLTDITKTNSSFRSVSLRYFNPIGAHHSGKIGEDPKGIPNNLLPYITQIAIGKRDKLKIFGGDYPTSDGTCVRDYLHVMDLAEGHVAALTWLEKNPNFSGSESFNLGTGEGTSVLEIINSFEKATSLKIPYLIVDRRPGDLPSFWADPSKAHKVLDWKAKKSLHQMMIDSWCWQSKNPDGF
jgi:UDP-glucose 4-epimerase